MIKLITKPSGLRCLRVGALELQLSTVRGSRAAPIHWELYRGHRIGYLSFGWASSTVHRWWACTIWLYWQLDRV